MEMNITGMELHRTGVLVWHRDKVGEVCTFVRYEWEQADQLIALYVDAHCPPILPPFKPKRKKS